MKYGTLVVWGTVFALWGCGKPTQTSVAVSPRLDGGMTGSGGEDDIAAHHAPWFSATGPIQYCVVRTDGFALSARQAGEELRAAFQEWQSTLFYLQTQTRGNSQVHALSGNFREVRCGQGEHFTVQLGTSVEPRVDGGRRAAPRILALASRDSHVVWFAPGDFWGRPNLFYNVALHEIGHVLGLRDFNDADQSDDARGLPDIMHETYPARMLHRRGSIPRGTTRGYELMAALESNGIWGTLDSQLPLPAALNPGKYFCLAKKSRQDSGDWDYLSRHLSFGGSEALVSPRFAQVGLNEVGDPLFGIERQSVRRRSILSGGRQYLFELVTGSRLGVVQLTLFTPDGRRTANFLGQGRCVP